MVPDDLVAEHGATLTGIAEHAIRAELETGHRWEPDLELVAIALCEPGASFVTLERGSELLGCVGSIEPVAPLALDVARRARAAAFADPRFDPVDADLYPSMTITVSVLSPLVPLAVASRPELVAVLRPGVDGLLVQAGRHRATFLPAVWDKVVSASSFVDLLWHKAGLAAGTWPRDLQAWHYTTASFHAPPPRTPLRTTASSR